MQVVECEQGSTEWWAAKQGIPSASSFDRIVTPKKGGPSKSQEVYICELIADRFLGVPMGIESYTSRAMQEGIDQEPNARKWYEFDVGVDVKQVGFCVTDDGRFGCSPDGLVKGNGGLELKCPQAKTHIAYLLDGGLPDAYKCQVHGSLVVTGRAWWDFMSYVEGLPPLVVRVQPDEFTKTLAEELDKFHAKYEAAIKRVEELGVIEAHKAAQEVALFG